MPKSRLNGATAARPERNSGKEEKAPAMLDFGPSAAFLIAFIGAIGSILGVYAGTGLAARPRRQG